MMSSNNPTNVSDLHDIKQPPGIYVALLVSPESKENIFSFCKNHLKLDMMNSESPYEKRSHATLFSAKETNGQTHDSFNEYMEEKTFLAHAVKWDTLYSENTNKTCLILKIECDELLDFHNSLISKSGLKHSFPTYLPHISVHYDYNGELPTELPTFNISLQEMYTKPYFFKPVPIEEIASVSDIIGTTEKNSNNNKNLNNNKIGNDYYINKDINKEQFFEDKLNDTLNHMQRFSMIKETTFSKNKHKKSSVKQIIQDMRTGFNDFNINDADLEEQHSLNKFKMK